MRLKILSLLFFFLPFKLLAQRVDIINQATTSSIRGLSVVDDKVAWVSGSKGTVGITIDGGKTWSWPIIKGFEKADFRDIEAFSDKVAIIISSGTPALILKTTDGGQNWEPNYQNADKAYFLDALEFDGSKHGVVLGDPINGKFLILETFDAGESWALAKNQPDALANEAAFAASGTCIRHSRTGFSIVTGGSTAHLINLGKRIDSKPEIFSIPIIQGKDSQGAFSIAFGKKNCVIVGGDYSKDKRVDSVATYSSGSQWMLSNQQPAGYQSCVEYLRDDAFLSTGTPGSNLTIDGGKSWLKIDSNSFNVCRKAKQGSLILLAGDRGKIGIYNP